MEDFKYNILAVDDEPFNLESIQRTFRNIYSVYVTTSPMEALKIFKNENIHLVIADQRMPDMLGTELLNRMREISPYPIRIILSAYTDIEYLIEAINRGEVYRYITKPWDPNELKITVAKALEHYQTLMDRLKLIKELQLKNQHLNATLQELKDAQAKILEMERLSVIGKMASMIIHDLKQPLDIIRSAAETMTRQDLDESERMEFSTMIKFEVDRFLEMVQELLDYSRGSFQLDLEPIQLSDFWIITEPRLKNYLKNYDIDVRFIVDNKDAIIRIDRYQFQRVLINLIRNALDALKNVSDEIERPQIFIRVLVNENQVVFEIEDNGPGIPDEIRERIFTPFVTGEHCTGIGLGLAIVKNILDKHGAKIQFATTPGKGTIFSIYLKREG